MEELAATFEQENNVKVTVEASPWVDYWTKLTTEMTSGNAPDVIEMYASRYPSFRDQLTDISDTEVNLDDYNAADALVGEDDEVYGLPYSHNTNALLYNKTLLAEAGIPEEQLTWDPETGGTLLEAAKKLTKGDVYGFPVFNNDQDLYLNMIAGNGGWVMDDDGREVPVRRAGERRGARVHHLAAERAQGVAARSGDRRQLGQGRRPVQGRSAGPVPVELRPAERHRQGRRRHRVGDHALPEGPGR
jgi:ABC-type glycerol-3-phosphate transport system substrate-binding protein